VLKSTRTFVVAGVVIVYHTPCVKSWFPLQSLVGSPNSVASNVLVVTTTPLSNGVGLAHVSLAGGIIWLATISKVPPEFPLMLATNTVYVVLLGALKLTPDEPLLHPNGLVLRTQATGFPGDPQPLV
jgi:hypothetical protein